MKNIENTEICPLTKIPYLKLNQGQHPCLFVHANGYPSHCYLPMLEQLSGCEVYAPLSRPCWDKSDPNMTDQWPLLFNDFLAFSQARFDQTGKKMTIIGHSMGCVVALRAIIHSPELFDKVVFIEPIFIAAHLVEVARLIPARIKRRLKLVSKTLSRPDQWSSLQQAYDFHRTKRAFKQLNDPALWQYIIGATTSEDQHWRLSYPKAWEAWFYQNPPRTWRYLKQLTLPTLGMRAENSEFLTVKDWQKWQDIMPHDKFIEFKGQHHLLPMEIPQQVAHTILDFIEKN